MQNGPEYNKGKRILRIAGLGLGVLVMLAFTVLGILWIISLRTPEKMAAFQGQIASLGIGGWLVLLAIQYVQIVVAFIPGGPIQVAAGALYGPLGGLSICLVGTVLATFTAFSLVKRFGRRAITLLVEEKDILKYDFISNSQKLERLVLALFFIPGTPKDALTYIFALTPITARRFMLLSTFARIPAMFTSILAGDSIVQGLWTRAVGYFLAITAVSLGGLLLHRRVSTRRKDRKKG